MLSQRQGKTFSKADEMMSPSLPSPPEDLPPMRTYQRRFASQKLSWLLILLAFGLRTGEAATAQTVPSTGRVGVAVLVDVSGSMRFTAANWKTEVRTSLNNFITGGTLNENVWRVDGEADEAFVKRIRSGNPIYVPPRPLLVAQVGEIDASYPFLQTLQLRTPQTLNEAGAFLRRSFPQQFNDQWTYLDVGHAIMRDRMLEQGAKQWYVIQISDEDPDYSEQTPEAARRLANGYAANLLTEEPLALAFRDDTALRMKLFRYTSKVDPCETDSSRPLCDDAPGPEPSTPTSTQRVRLRTPQAGASVEEDAIEFRWTATSGLSRFDLVLRDEEGGLVDRTRTRQKRHWTGEPLDGGTYTWHVVGYGETERVRSSEQSFSVAGESSGAVWWLLGLLLVGGGAAYGYNFYQRRQRRRL